MSAPIKNLLLDLRMERITGGKILDASPNQRHAQVVGKPTLVYDNRAGNCLRFGGKGDYLQIPGLNAAIDYSAGFAVMALVRYERFGSWARIVDFGCGAPDHNIVLTTTNLNNGDLVLQVFPDKGLGGFQQVSLSGALQARQWFHLAATIAPDGKMQLYKNGVALLTVPQAGTLPPRFDRNSCFIGHSNWSANEDFQGEMAFVQVYNRSLSPEEIWQSYAASLLTPGRTPRPLAYDLYDDNQDAVIYIEDHPQGPGQRLHLTLTNTSNVPLFFNPAAEYHLRLRFRKGVLSAAPVLTETDGWQMAKAVEPQNLYETYNLKYSGSPSLAAGAKLELVFTNLKVSGQGGARGTCVALVAQGLFSTPEFVTDTEVRDVQEHHLNLVNHRGKKHIPLHVGFVGSNTILNDGQAHEGNKLKLRFTNTSTERDMALKPADGDASNKPKLVLWFDVSDNTAEEWALATVSQAKNVRFKMTDAVELKDASGALTAAPYWCIEQNNLPTSLGPQKFFDVEISNLVSGHPTGAANLYVRYENIPGYWDGQFVCQIEKSPLLYRNQFVGLGISEPQAKLHVHTPGFTAEQVGFRMGGEGQFVVDAPGVIGGRLAILANGNIGIGTNAPKNKLTVSGNAAIGYATDSAPTEGLIVKGQAGIGTPSPLDPLHVKGALRVEGEQGTFRVHPHFDQFNGTVLLGTFDGNNNGPHLRFQSTGKGFVDIGQNQTGDFIVETSSDALRLIVKQDGKVGIGTATPQTQLHVNGEVKATGNVYGAALVFTDAGGNPYPDNWIGMANNFDSFKWLHLGGITDGAGSDRLRRIALFSDVTLLGGLKITRIVAGRVGKDGSKLAGAGFTSSRTGTGSYVINFDASFRGTPICVATVDTYQAGNGADNHCSVECGNSQFKVFTWTNQSAEDTPFYFIALGIL